jgi:hypothetical protein
MKATIKKVLTGAVLVAVLALGVSAIVEPSSTFAAVNSNVTQGISDTNAGGTTVTSLPDVFKFVVNILLYIIGAISVIMLIVGGIRYAVSAGNSANVTAAKNTIMYALIGLVIAVLAYAIVNFVLGAVTSGSTTGP